MSRASSGDQRTAQISVTVESDTSGDRYVVSVTGCLSRLDLKRLEVACGRALEHRTPPLELQIVADPAAIDASAHFFLECLRARGVVIVERPSAPSE